MTFGRSANSFLVNTPQAVAQCVLTRLKLFQGEWFLDNTQGTPWNTQILGNVGKVTADSAIQTAIVETTGVVSLNDYYSVLDPTTRTLSVSCTIVTIFSQTTQIPIQVSL